VREGIPRKTRARRLASLFVPAALVAGLLAGAAVFLGEAQEREPSAAGTPEQTPAQIQARTGECTICARMVQVAGADEFAHDVHTFACAECHHPHNQRTAEDWNKTCQNDGCHPRAWPKTIFHRLDPEVFRDCRNCHIPHVFQAHGQDCTSCHGGAHPAPGTVAAPDVAGAGTFPHERHRDLPCATCHESKTEHAKLIMTDFGQCMSCHHGPEQKKPCETCHGDAMPAAGITKREVTVAMSVWDKPRKRSLPFDHDMHSGILDCDSCHPAASGFAVKADCASCHDSHHNEDANCIGCHEAPPGDAHDVDIHETFDCSTCHENAFTKIPLEQRNFCLVCHQDKADHNTGKNCASCHKLTPKSVH